MRLNWTIALAIAVPLLSALIGYFLGSLKFFRERQVKTYEEVLPVLLKFMFERQISDEKDFNSALSRIWLYGSRRTALQLDEAISFWVDSRRGDPLVAIKETIIAMRKDVQPGWLPQVRRIKEEEIKHFYVKAK